MMNQIVIFCPTRGRNENHKRLAASFLATNPQRTTLVFSLDADDQQNYERVTDERIEYVVGEPARLIQILNRMAHFYERKAGSEIFGLLGDDCIFQTTAWEAQVVDAYNDGALVIAPSDGLRDSRFPNHYFVAVELVRAIGFMAPPELEHLYGDNFLFDIGHAIGRYRYLPLVYIEHRHYIKDASLKDATYARANSDEQNKRDGAAYARYCKDHFQDDVEHLKITLGITSTIQPVKVPGFNGRKLRVMVATPFGQMSNNLNYLRCVMTELAVLVNAGFDVHFQPVMNPVCGDITQRQRNVITQHFRKHPFKADLLVWLDADMGFTGEDILRMICSGLPVVGLNAPRRNYYFDGGCNGTFTDGESLRSAFLRGTIQPMINRPAETSRCMTEVLYVGTGVMVIWDYVIEKIIAAGLCKRLRFGTDTSKDIALDDYWQLWWFPVTAAGHVFGEGIELGEDQNFCDLTRAVGFKVWCDPRAGASHCGLHEFVGKPRWHEEMAQHYIPKPTTTKE